MLFQVRSSIKKDKYNVSYSSAVRKTSAFAESATVFYMFSLLLALMFYGYQANLLINKNDISDYFFDYYTDNVVEDVSADINKTNSLDILNPNIGLVVPTVQVNALKGGIVLPSPSLIDNKELKVIKKSDLNKVKRLSSYIATKYYISDEYSKIIVSRVYEYSYKHKSVDPLLFLSVMAVESRFNPIAESVVGAKGLSQVYGKYHKEKIAKIVTGNAETGMFRIEENIELGVKIFAEYLNKYDGNETLALLQYNGSLTDVSQKYAKKVLNVKAGFERQLNS